jgi:aarF domain-containing kinase
MRTFREVAVPASPLSRVWGFGSLAASMVAGAIGEATSRAVFTGPAGGGGGGVLASGGMSEAQAERLAEGLCRLRGAALKLGQMLSLSDEALVPPAVLKALERVRAQADVMPKRQLEAQMVAELGPDWRARLGGDAFQDAPVAAASIGQVHRSVLPDGRAVAIKVQYPGVAESIDSDLNNLRRLLSVANFLPKGLYLDPMIDVAREELKAECDYLREAEAQKRYRALVADDPDFEVPAVVPELSTRRVLVTTWLPGVPIDAVAENGTPPEERNRIARKLLKLTLKELFEWRFMQVGFFACNLVPPPPIPMLTLSFHTHPAPRRTPTGAIFSTTPGPSVLGCSTLAPRGITPSPLWTTTFAWCGRRRTVTAPPSRRCPSALASSPATRAGRC